MIDLLVQNPIAIAVIAGIFFVAYLVVHRALGHAQAGWLLLPGAAWAQPPRGHAGIFDQQRKLPGTNSRHDDPGHNGARLEQARQLGDDGRQVGGAVEAAGVGVEAVEGAGAERRQLIKIALFCCDLVM